MKILLVSYYAEAHLSASSAQNTRFLATSLACLGHEVRVVCGASEDGSEEIGNYRLRKLPLASPAWRRGWLGAFRADARVREMARRELAAWLPDVVLVGAWKHLTEVVLEARRRGVPAVQIVHDYSLICLRQWLLDSADRLCTGPTSQAKCRRCMSSSRGWRRDLESRLLSLPLLSRLAETLLGTAWLDGRYCPAAIDAALTHMEAYRRSMTLFVAQAPSVVDILGTADIEPDRCRFLPQFIGEERLEKYPRPDRPPGVARPVRFAYVGRWFHPKGPDLLLEAFVEAHLDGSAELWIISGNADPALEGGVRDAGDEKRIRVFAGAEGGEVSRLLARCDVAVVPSRCRELASRVVLEAHAQGVPVVASSTVGNNYLIHDGENGRVFPSGDRAALRRQLEEIVARPSMIRDWSSQVPEPICRPEWTAQILAILEEAIELQNSLSATARI